MAVSEVSAGTCEVHGEYATGLELVRLHEGTIGLFLPNQVERSIFTNPFLACLNCRTALRVLAGDGVEMLVSNNVKEDSVEIVLDETSSYQEKLVKRFADLKTIFPAEIRDIYVIPEEEVANSPYPDKLNILVWFNSLSLLEYIGYVQREKKSAMHLWNKANFRHKYFGTKTLRILIGLARLHLSSIELSVWVGSYTRIVSMDFFCGSSQPGDKHPLRMVGLRPNRLLKVT